MNLLKILVLLTYFPSVLMFIPSNELESVSATNANNIVECIEQNERLKSLEPEEPITIMPENNTPYYTQFEMLELINTGTNYPFEFAYNDPNWVRAIYYEHWHSKVADGRWSYVPERLEQTRRRFFIGPITASSSYQFEQNLGILTESNPKPPKAGYNHNYISQLVFMNFDVKNIIINDNNFIVVGTPKRNGLQIIYLYHEDIKEKPKNGGYNHYLVTPEGYEIESF